VTAKIVIVTIKGFSATSTLDVQHADTSCYLQHSPMVDRNVDYSSSYSLPNSLPNSNHHHDPSAHHVHPLHREYRCNCISCGHYEFKSESSQEDPITARLNSLGISQDNNDYPKRRKLSISEKTSYDYRTTLPPLMEHSNSLSHTHDQSVCTNATFDYSSQCTVSNGHTNHTNAPISSQLSPVYPSYHPNSRSPLSKIPPIRSRTLPSSYISSQQQHHQLPTPRTSIDAQLTQYPRKSFDSYNDNFSSNTSDNNN
ncbi:35775_t:CDS:1, partial [Racocetra persica]